MSIRYNPLTSTHVTHCYHKSFGGECSLHILDEKLCYRNEKFFESLAVVRFVYIRLQPRAQRVSDLSWHLDIFLTLFLDIWVLWRFCELSLIQFICKYFIARRQNLHFTLVFFQRQNSGNFMGFVGRLDNVKLILTFDISITFYVLLSYDIKNSLFLRYFIRVYFKCGITSFLFFEGRFIPLLIVHFFFLCFSLNINCIVRSRNGDCNGNNNMWVILWSLLVFQIKSYVFNILPVFFD